MDAAEPAGAVRKKGVLMRLNVISINVAMILVFFGLTGAQGADNLESGFANPPDSA